MYLAILFGACFIFSTLVTMLMVVYTKPKTTGIIHIVQDNDSDVPYLMLTVETSDVVRGLHNGQHVTFIVNDMRSKPQ